MTKKDFLNLIEKWIKDEWEPKALQIAVEMQEKIKPSELSLKDLAFSVISNDEHTEEFLCNTFHFSFEEEEILIDFLLPYSYFEADEEFGSGDTQKLLSHGCYKIHENDFDDGDVFEFRDGESKERFENVFLLVDTLNYLELNMEIYKYHEALFNLMEESQKINDEKVFAEYKEFLTGIKEIKNTFGKEVTIVLENGLVIDTNKSNLFSQLNAKKIGLK